MEKHRHKNHSTVGRLFSGLTVRWVVSGGNKGNSLANEVVEREENRLCGRVRLTIFHLPQMIHSNIVNYLHHTIIATSWHNHRQRLSNLNHCTKKRHLSFLKTMPQCAIHTIRVIWWRFFSRFFSRLLFIHLFAGPLIVGPRNFSMSNSKWSASNALERIQRNRRTPAWATENKRRKKRDKFT